MMMSISAEVRDRNLANILARRRAERAEAEGRDYAPLVSDEARLGAAREYRGYAAAADISEGLSWLALATHHEGVVERRSRRH